nr:hypothetical protein BaRGS_034847 [Batillaria attramentaria]
MLNTALGFLSQNGGVFLGENVILTKVPADIDRKPFWFSFSKSSSDVTRESNRFQFLHFLSVLSALHVGGFEHVYVHGEVRPEGRWWDELNEENVTFVRLEKPEAHYYYYYYYYYYHYY